MVLGSARQLSSSAAPARIVHPFEYSQPTQVIFGAGAASKAGSFAGVLGRRALVVCGDLSARANGALPDVTGALDEARVPYELLEGVPANPGTRIVDAGAALARAGAYDVVVGVGGGSVLDVSKAVATAAISRRPFRQHLSGIRDSSLYVEATLPVIAVPTLPGSGSETNGTSVIVDEVTGRKLSAHSDLAAPRVALLDPAYAASAPAELLVSGVADTMCHAIEAGLSTRASIASDALAQGAVFVLLREGARATEGDVEAMGACLWAASLAGQALTLAGSIVTHPLAHPISARFAARHGDSVAALEPVVLATLAGRWGSAMVKLAGWFGSRATEEEPALRAVLKRLASWNRSVGVTAGIADLGVAREHVATLVEDALASGSRGLAAAPGPPLDDALLVRLFERALESRPNKAPALA